MKDELVTFNTAKLAKEKGFTELVSKYYITKTGKLLTLQWQGRISSYLITDAPTQTQLQRWFREEHEILIYVKPVYNEKKQWYGIFKKHIHYIG